MKNFLRSAKIFWYVIWSGAFIFGCMVSVMVVLGVAGSDGNQWLAGLFTLAVFWYASSTYKKKAMALMDEQLKEIQKEREDDEHSDDSL
jgi:hypothetical protein